MHQSLLVGPNPINNYMQHQRNNYPQVATPASAPVGSRLRGIDQPLRAQTLNSNERAQLAMMMAYQQVPASSRHYQQILNTQSQQYSSPTKKSGQANTTKNQFDITNLSPEVKKSDIKQIWEEIGKIKHYVKRMKKNHLGAAPDQKKKYVNKPIRVKYIHLEQLKVSTVTNPMKAKNIKNNTIRGVIKFQARVRGSLVRSRFRHFKVNLRAAIRIQSFVRGCLARKKLHKAMSPTRWSSPTKKELSYCRDMKNLLSKVSMMENELKVLKDAKESHEKALRYLFGQLASLKRPQEPTVDQTQAETERVNNNEES